MTKNISGPCPAKIRLAYKYDPDSLHPYMRASRARKIEKMAWAVWLLGIVVPWCVIIWGCTWIAK